MTRATAPYDRKAAVYDAIVGRPGYHRVFWGTSTQSFGRFGRAALEAAGDRPFAEVGCGSLLFTAPMYRDARGAVALVDRSMGMLSRGRKRLGSPESPPAGAVGPVVGCLAFDSLPRRRARCAAYTR